MKIFAIVSVLGAASLVFAAGNMVDESDLPPIQKEQWVESVPLNPPEKADVSRWDSLEQAFVEGLSTQERERYMVMKEAYIVLRAQLLAKRDSMAGLTPDQRKAAIEQMRAEISAQLNQVETEIMNRLQLEARNALISHRAEIERKREETARQLEGLRQRIQGTIQ
jgi:glutathione S-transferase